MALIFSFPHSYFRHWQRSEGRFIPLGWIIGTAWFKNDTTWYITTWFSNFCEVHFLLATIHSKPSHVLLVRDGQYCIQPIHQIELPFEQVNRWSSDGAFSDCVLRTQFVSDCNLQATAIFTCRFFRLQKLWIPIRSIASNYNWDDCLRNSMSDSINDP